MFSLCPLCVLYGESFFARHLIANYLELVILNLRQERFVADA